MKVIITGGAGYIGSHVVKLLGKLGHDLLIVDDLSSGHRDSLLYGDFVQGNVGDKDLMTSVVKGFQPDAVMHFAAFIQVGESVSDPLKYYKNNTLNTINLLEVLLENNIDKFVFSSTAAVYGVPDIIPVDEKAPLMPINPYGSSKSMVEHILKDLSSANDFNYCALRYFNVAGADPEGELGQNYLDATHLITRALKTAKGELPFIEVFGTDYPTKDGTGVRDYIHVNDLAGAHLAALNFLASGGESDVFNLGYGHGYSVKEIIEISKKVTGIDFEVRESPRREGDPAELISDNRKILSTLDWNPEYDDIEFIIKTAYEWEKNL